MDSINIPIDTYNVVNVVLIVLGIVLVFGSIIIIYFYDKLTEKSDNVWSGIGLVFVWSVAILGISSFMAGVSPLPTTVSSSAISKQLEEHGYTSPVNRDIPIVNGEMLVLADQEQNTCIGTINIKDKQLYVSMECKKETPSEYLKNPMDDYRDMPMDYNGIPMDDYRDIPMDYNGIPMDDYRDMPMDYNGIPMDDSDDMALSEYEGF